MTRLVSATDFDVDGLHVVVGSGTTFAVSESEAGVKWRTVRTPPAPYLGERIQIFGRQKGRQINAQQVILFPPADHTVSGLAMVEHATSEASGSWLLEADGRHLRVSAALLNARPAKGAATVADLHANEWVEYHGVEGADGIVTLDRAGFAENAVNSSEAKLRNKLEFDAAAVTEDDQQSGLRTALLGKDFRRIPAYHDAALQARVDAIGTKLIPAFQKQLAPDDPTRINFRFQLVDQPKWRDAITLPSGIILVPRQIAEQLTDDAQLAAVLADNIGTAFEKQDFLLMKTMRTLSLVNLGGAAAGAVIPGAGLVTMGVTMKKGIDAESAARRQSGRVALSLMQDAGYDIRQAPEAWWNLTSKNGKDRSAEPPARALNQFAALGTTWRSSLQPASEGAPVGRSGR